MANPYLIEGPALISFSGGRTSAYMLHRILEAHGGTLPDNVHVVFANTGKEREETLRFVHECEVRWGVRVHWIEYRVRPKGQDGRLTPWSDRFTEVGYNSASRNGEPLEALITRKQYTPNSVTRFCTADAKIDIMKAFMLARGYSSWANVVGLRGDEMHRVFKMFARNDSGKERWKSVMPLATKAGGMISRRDVEEFWAAQDFDLGLQPYEGNCDLCFLKSKAKLKRLIRADPSRALWWSRMEKTVGKGRFVTEYSYEDLVNEVAREPLLPLEEGDDEEFDAECGLWCGNSEDAA